MKNPRTTGKTFRSSEKKLIDSVRPDPEELGRIRQLIRRGEGTQIEFKAKANHPDKIARSLVSFANSSGGTLLLGVHDDGEMIGVRDPGEDVSAIIRILRTARPDIRCRHRVAAVSATRWIVSFEVRESRRKPVLLRQDKGTVYLRSGDQTLQAGEVMVAVLYLRTSSRGQFIECDEREQAILRVLQKNGRIGVSALLKATGLGRPLLVQRLAGLVSAGIVHLEVSGGEEFFRLA